LERPSQIGNLEASAKKSLSITPSYARDFSMSDSNTFDFETLPQIETLLKSLGGLDECKRLGFIVDDQHGVISLSTAGLGYLIYVRAGGITNLAEAFAAGRQCALEELEDMSEALPAGSAATR
jgi:hypothetical protein